MYHQRKQNCNTHMATEKHNSLQKEVTREWKFILCSFPCNYDRFTFLLVSGGSLKNYYLACFKSTLFSSHVFEILGQKMD